MMKLLDYDFKSVIKNASMNNYELKWKWKHGNYLIDPKEVRHKGRYEQRTK